MLWNAIFTISFQLIDTCIVRVLPQKYYFKVVDVGLILPNSFAFILSVVLSK